MAKNDLISYRYNLNPKKSPLGQLPIFFDFPQLNSRAKERPQCQMIPPGSKVFTREFVANQIEDDVPWR
jgi:hypothetical protein